MVKILRKLKILFRLLLSIPSDFKGGNITPCDILLLDHDASRNLIVKNKGYSAFIDSAGDYFEEGGFKCASLGDMGSTKVGKEAYRSPISINLWHFFALFNVPFYPEKTLLIRKYVQIFKASNCKAIVAVTPSKIFCKVANSEGIPVFELIHGIGYQKEYIKSHYIHNISPLEIPQYFICFDKITYTSFLKYFPKERIIGVKHHLVSRFFPGSNLGILDEWRLQKKTMKKLACYKKTVLVSLQWGFDGELEELKGVIKNGVIHDSLIDAINETKEDIAWIIRLHPVQLTVPYKRHLALIIALENKYSNVIFNDVSTVPLPEVLNYCDSHITAISMTCYEAAWLGVHSYAFFKSFLAKESEYIKYFSDIEEYGLLTNGRPTKKAIIEFILTTSKNKSMPFDFSKDFSTVGDFIKRNYL